MTPENRCNRAAGGFTLVEVVVVLLIFGIVVAMAAAITRGVVAAQKRSMTSTRIATVEAALVQFVMQQKRLPCPADGTKPSTDNNAGIETARTAGAGCTTNMQNGVVPWRALALTETEMTDGWDRRLTYRVAPELAMDNGMDMSWCDPAGTGAAIGGAVPNQRCQSDAATCGTANATNPIATVTACTPPATYLRGKGLQVRDVAGTVLMNPETATTNPPTAAAYVVISHGETGGGGYLQTGTLAASTIGEGTEETKNFATGAFVNNTVTYYVDNGIVDTPGAGHFDDILLRPSIMALASKAGLGPRTH